MISIPLLMLSGFFSSDNNFAPFLIPIKYLSLFKHLYQILIENEFGNNNPLICMNVKDKCTEVFCPSPCNPMKDFNFKESMAVSFAVTSALGLFLSIIGYTILYFLVKIKR